MSNGQEAGVALQNILAVSDCLADAQAIQHAIARVAEKISVDLSDAKPVVLCVMKGGLVFAGHLLPQLNFPLEFDYVHATRYNDGTHGAALQWRVSTGLPLACRHVLLIDDILDVGITLDAIVADCFQRGAESVRTAVLVDKVHDRKVRAGMQADYACLVMPDRYLFGYGMDYEGWWRNAPGIYALQDERSLDEVRACLP